MTEQERIEQFGKEFDALVKKYGVAVVVELVPRALGPIIQVEPKTSFGVIPGWVEPIESEKPAWVPSVLAPPNGEHK